MICVLVKRASAVTTRLTRLQLKKQKEKIHADTMSLSKKCSVKLVRIPSDELVQYADNVALGDGPVTVHQLVETTESSVRLNPTEKTLSAPVSAASGSIPSDDAIATCSNSTVNDHNKKLIIAKPKSAAATNQSVQLPEKKVVLIDVPYRLVTRRDIRVMPCIDSFDDRDESQKNDLNPVIQPSSIQQQTVHQLDNTAESSVRLDSTVNKLSHAPALDRNGAVPKFTKLTVSEHNEQLINAKPKSATATNQPVQLPENNVALIDVPVHRVTRRDERVDSITFEDKDAFQESDLNPVMQPSPNKQQTIKGSTPEESVRSNSKVNELSLATGLNRSNTVSTRSNCAVNVQHEHLTTAKPKMTAVKNECSQCLISNQKIVQLKKQIEDMRSDSLVSMAQYDKLQDACTKLIEKNIKLQAELVKYRKIRNVTVKLRSRFKYNNFDPFITRGLQEKIICPL